MHVNETKEIQGDIRKRVDFHNFVIWHNFQMPESSGDFWFVNIVKYKCNETSHFQQSDKDCNF